MSPLGWGLLSAAIWWGGLVVGATRRAARKRGQASGGQGFAGVGAVFVIVGGLLLSPLVLWLMMHLVDALPPVGVVVGAGVIGGLDGRLVGAPGWVVFAAIVAVAKRRRR